MVGGARLVPAVPVRRRGGRTELASAGTLPRRVPRQKLALSPTECQSRVLLTGSRRGSRRVPVAAERRRTAAARRGRGRPRRLARHPGAPAPQGGTGPRGGGA